MTKSVSHYIFDSAVSHNAKIEDEDKHGPFNAINLGSDSAYYAVAESEDNPPVLECRFHAPVEEDIQILEIAFVKGKLRKTTFAVDYIDTDLKKHHVGTYESAGRTNDYEKFMLPERVKDVLGIVITFKRNSDRSPWFNVRGVRLARFVEKTL